ncbi:MFS transporter [Nocardioides sp. SYSU DS0663]|uniref:MFS transporter n=1 Tax=Nocardioides sp. SYSU DS0663 TaxID=3416445 RepID=UPI003F4C6525
MNSYLAALRTPGVLRVTASQLVARLPLGMLSLATLLHVQALSGSFARAGLVVACMTLAEAVAMPVSGRLLGRLDARAVVATFGSAHAVALLALAWAGDVLWLLCVLAAVVGATVPPIMPAVRALYPSLTSADGVRALFALDTTAQELIWIIGPLLATVLAASGSTSLALVAAAAVTLVGTLWFASSPALGRRVATGTRGRFGRVLGHRSVFVAMATSAGLMASFTALEVGIVARYEHDPLMAGAVIAVPSAASLIGGLAWGHRRFDLRTLTAALLLVAVGTAAAGAPVPAPAMLVALFVSGLGFAPALAAVYYMVSNVVDQLAAAEAFGWLQTAALVGAATGTSISGVAGEAHGPVGCFVVATTLACLATVTPGLVRVRGPLAGLHPFLDRPNPVPPEAEVIGRR